MKEMKYFNALILVVFVLTICGLVSGCKSMANPDGTDLNWAERESWEGVPGALQSMLNE